MKRLLTLSLLLLFSVDAFAQDEYCKVYGPLGAFDLIDENCEEGQLLWVKVSPDYGIGVMSFTMEITARYCDFNREIVIEEEESVDGKVVLLQCVLHDDKRRWGEQFIFN